MRQPWFALVLGVASTERPQREPKVLRKPLLCKAKILAVRNGQTLRIVPEIYILEDCRHWVLNGGRTKQETGKDSLLAYFICAVLPAWICGIKVKNVAAYLDVILPHSVVRVRCEAFRVDGNVSRIDAGSI